MATITIEAFCKWMDAYGKASENDDPQASANLFATNARYHETPFDEPFEGRQAIHDYWANGAQTLTEKETAYEVLAVQGNRGIARWQAKFRSRATGKRSILDCVFLVEFNEDGLCSEFREWWHIKTFDTTATQEGIC